MLSRESDADCYPHARLDYHATVRELPSNERPRERLEHFGAGALVAGRAAGHHPQVPRPDPLPQPSQRRSDALAER
jgi:hypothetical protein